METKETNKSKLTVLVVYLSYMKNVASEKIMAEGPVGSGTSRRSQICQILAGLTSDLREVEIHGSTGWILHQLHKYTYTHVKMDIQKIYMHVYTHTRDNDDDDD